jgi:hypothetical protein
MDIIQGKKVEETDSPPSPEARDVVKVDILCPTCQREYHIDQSLLGKKATCKSCGTSFVMSLPQSPPPLPDSPPPPDLPPQIPATAPEPAGGQFGDPVASVSDSAGTRAGSWGVAAGAAWQRFQAASGPALRQGWKWLKAVFSRGAPVVAGACAAKAAAFGTMIKFYWVRRGDLCWLMLAYLPRARDYAWQRRQIAVSVWNEYSNAQWDGSHWDIRLPDRCVVCGQAEDLAAKAELSFAADLFWPLWALLTGIAVGVGVGLLWRPWLLPIPILIGMVIGYLASGKKETQIRYQRCPKHIENDVYPRFYASGSWVCVHVGHSAVKARFLAETRGAAQPIIAQSEALRTSAPQAITPAPGDKSEPATIAVDEAPIILTWDEPQ